MNTKKNRVIRDEIVAFMHREATIIAKNDEDIASELFLKAVDAMDRFDPSRGILLKTYLSSVMQKSYLSIKRRLARISEREAYDVDLTLEMAPLRRSPVSYKYESEEMEFLYRIVMTKLDAEEQLIVRALLKSESCRSKALRLLASRGVFYSAGTFSKKILPALKAKVKGIIG